VVLLRGIKGQGYDGGITQLGFEYAKPLPYGLKWDTNHRLNTIDKDWMGGGDLRYVLRKKSPILKLNSDNPLHAKEVAPDISFDHEIISRFSPRFDEINNLAKANPLEGLVAHRIILLETASQLRSDEPFNPDKFESMLDRTINLLHEISIKMDR
jgi:hypothetical protein